jgi:hypothetical protein
MAGPVTAAPANKEGAVEIPASDAVPIELGAMKQISSSLGMVPFVMGGDEVLSVIVDASR